MRRLLFIAALSALTVAKPEHYREKEDFQYARSSSDDGSKSGFYGAQRGNMGGNFERAHNMDGLAQNQMSGLVRQVEGELGEGSKTRTGSVFTAANSRGIYGSGHYDLSNLEGRNFQEGVSYGDSQSHSSLTSQSGYNAQSSALDSAAYGSSHSHSSRHHSGYSGYQSSGQSGQASNLQASSGYLGQASNLQASSGYSGQASNLLASSGYSGLATNLQAADRVSRYDYGGQAASGHYTRSGYDGQSTYDQSGANSHLASDYGSNSQSRVTAIPVRIVVRPGTKVAIPIAAQTYDKSQTGALYDQNSVNSEAELLTNHGQQNIYKPSNGAKHYESSYSYRKEWEKHDTKPVNINVLLPVTTDNPFPKNSELYEDTQAHTSGREYDSTGINSQSSQSSDAYSKYNANIKSGLSSQSRYQANYNNQHQGESSVSNAEAYSRGVHNSGGNTDSNNQVEDLNNKPKSYHSSYSYHKSWERQGDPYVIKPVSSSVYDGQTSQKLTAASSNQGTWSSHNYGSRYQQTHQNSVNGEDCDCDENGHIRVARSYNANQYQEVDPYQQSQNVYEQGQQTQNLEDLGQETQSKWDNLEDLGQQTQNKWDTLEDLGQQTQNKWDKLEDAGQQTQNKWDNLEDLGQQTQTQWDKLEDDGQHTQNAQNNFGEQQTQHNQQIQNTWSKLDIGTQDNNGQHTEDNWNSLNSPQQVKYTENSQSQGTLNRQESVTESGKLYDLNPLSHTSQIQNKPKNHKVETTWHKDDILEPYHIDIQNSPTREDPHHDINDKEKDGNFEQQLTQKEDLGQELQNSWNSDAFSQSVVNSNDDATPIWGAQSTDEKFMPSSLNLNMNRPSTQYFENNKQTENQNTFSQHSHAYINNWNTQTGFHKQTNWQKQFDINHPFSNSNSQTSSEGPAPILSLWDKINKLEKQSTSSSNDDYMNTNHFSDSHGYHSLQNSYLNSAQGSSSSNHDLTQTDQNKPFRPHYAGYHPWQTNIFNEVTSTTKPDTSKDEHNKHHLLPSDVGRGDIGPEDSSGDMALTSTTTTETSFNTFENKSNSTIFIPNSTNKPYKTLAEIEALSLTTKPNKTTTETNMQRSDANNTHQSDNQQSDSSFRVTSSNKQTMIEHQRQYNNNMFPSTSTSSSSTTSRTTQFEINYQNSQSVNKKQVTPQNEGLNEDTINNNHHYTSTDEYNQFEQEAKSTFVNTQKYNEQGPVQIDRLNKEQQLEDFRQQVNFQQQNKEHQFEIVSKNSTNFNQSNSENFDQQNADQQFQSFEFQNSEHYNQQNTDQQVDNFGQLSEDLSQQNIDQLVNFEQQSNNFDQNSMDQQFVNFEQQSDNLSQQNTDHLENVNQQSDLSEKNVNLNQQLTELETLGEREKYNQNNTEQLANFGLQSQNLDQQSQVAEGGQLVDLGQQSQNLDQQSQIAEEGHLLDLGQQSQNLDEQSEITQQEHLEDLGQQVQTAWEPRENLQQQPDTSKIENFEVIPIQNTYKKEESYTSNYNHEQQSRQNISSVPSIPPTNTDVDSPTEPSTEKPGFWKSFGNKFLSAKEKISSWFQSS